MADNTIVFKNDERCYCKEAGLIVESRVISKNDSDSSILAYTSFRNISNKTIKGIKISLDVSDVFGSSLGTYPNLQYIDLSVKRNETFGDDLPVLLPDKNIRSYRVVVESVLYADDTVLDTDNGTYEVVPEPVNIEQIVPAELIEQYKRDTNNAAKYDTFAFSNLWMCPCGCFNTNEEETCFSCCKNVDFYLNARDVERLRNEKEEFEKAENERRIQIEAEKARKKKKTIISVIAVVSVAAFIAVSIIAGISSSNKKAAEEIYKNLLGRSFEDEISDDDNFVNEYSRGNTDNYKTYWLTKKSLKLVFKDDGSVVEYNSSSMTALAWPSILGDDPPEGFNHKYDFDYSSFSVKVSLSGKAYLILGGSKYKMYVSNERPTTIYYNDFVLN